MVQVRAVLGGSDLTRVLLVYPLCEEQTWTLEPVCVCVCPECIIETSPRLPSRLERRDGWMKVGKKELNAHKLSKTLRALLVWPFPAPDLGRLLFKRNSWFLRREEAVGWYFFGLRRMSSNWFIEIVWPFKE